jgi:hypothetical protein
MCYAHYGGLAYFCCVPFFDNAGSFGAVNVFDGIKIDYLILSDSRFAIR